MLPNPLVDREQEAAELRELVQRPGNHLAILYGRRQVGKTFLLGHIWTGRRQFYFLAADTTPELNRRELLGELSTQFGRRFDPEDYPTWRTVFRLIVELANQPLVVVLDEFQYLLGAVDDAASQLVAIWDREAVGRPLTLVLSGSEVATMEHLLAGGQPLYGRANWSARLHPFDYYDASRMLGERPIRERAIAYGIFGGIPRYLATIRSSESLRETAVRAILSPHGEIHQQLLTLIEQEKGIRDPRAYRSVLSAVAGGDTLVNRIAQGAGLGDQTHLVRRALEVLENMEIVARTRNYAVANTAPYRYYVLDNAVDFWHRFVVPNRSRLATGDPGEVWTAAVEPYLNDRMGNVFERIVAQAYQRFHTAWNLPSARVWADWTGRDRNGRSIQVDVVARLDDGTMLTGEIKWSSEPRSFELHNDLQRDLDDLGRSGYPWAEAAKEGRFVYVSAAGFTDRFRTWAENQPSVWLLTIENLYPENWRQ